MKIRFPSDFIFGTSTSAYQIETAVGHDWVDVRSRDGQLFNRTTDHESRIPEDIDIIASLAPHYRMSLMWSKLQKGPLAELDPEAVSHYKHLLQALTNRGVKIMMVLHHFANPLWFSGLGGWTNKRNINLWLDYAKKVVDTFGDYVTFWNTFNEPNLYCSMAYIAGEFPPFRKQIATANRVIRSLAAAHSDMYDYIKSRYPDKWVGLSHNCTIFEAENLLGVLPAWLVDYLYMSYSEKLFEKKDFFGMSYYARIGFDPAPLTYLTTPEKIAKSGKPHDDMWEYYPEGLEKCILRYWDRYKKPIIITENGICTNDDKKREQAIADYMKAVSNAIQKGADVRGYYHWSAWDNFEWNLGPTFQFGLYACDPLTHHRKKKPSADLYARLAYEKEIVLREL